MPRILKVLVALVLVAAVGVTAYVLLNSLDASRSAPPATPVAATPEPASPSVQPASANSAQAVSAGDSAAQADQAGGSAAPAAKADLKKLVNNLSPEQADKLYAAASKREKARRAEEERYRLAGDLYLGDPNLKLSADQEQRIKAVKQGLEPRIDETLKAVQGQFDDHRARYQELWNNKEQKSALDTQYMAQIAVADYERREIEQHLEQLQQPLDQEYLTQARAILTPEQAQAVDAAIAERQALQGIEQERYMAEISPHD